MELTAKAEYAVLAAVGLADATDEDPCRMDDIAQAQRIPARFLATILADLSVAGIVRSRRGPNGGSWLARSPNEITVAQIIRAVEGPLVYVHGQRPEEVSYNGTSKTLPHVWVAMRSNLRNVLEQVTVADIAAGKLPRRVLALASPPEAWTTR